MNAATLTLATADFYSGARGTCRLNGGSSCGGSGWSFSSAHIIALGRARVIAQPDVGVLVDVRTVPMQIARAAFELLFVRRQNIAEDQAVELVVAQVIGEIEHDVLLEQLFDRGPQHERKLMLAEPIRVRQHQRRIEPLARSAASAPVPIRASIRETRSRCACSSPSGFTRSIDSSNSGSSSSRSCALRSKCSTSSDLGDSGTNMNAKRRACAAESQFVRTRGLPEHPCHARALAATCAPPRAIVS